MKLGDDAIVDLTNFTLEGKSFKKLRSRNNQLEKSGVRVRFYDAPIPDDLIRSKLMMRKRAEGFTRFNLGMAPMSGFRELEEATAAEKAVHLFMQRLPFLFSFSGLKAWKAKFASGWEPRYLIYRRALDLPKVGVAMAKVSELTE